MLRDAIRWRISHIVYPRLMDHSYGYFHIRKEYHSSYVTVVGIQPHPVTKSEYINRCIMGEGKTEGEAIDAMILVLKGYVENGHSLPPEIQSILE